MKLLLTGSVIAACNVVRNDPDIRLLDYTTSCFLWITQSPFDELIYLNGDKVPILNDTLCELANKYNKKVSEIFFDLRHITQHQGIGQAESIMLNHAVQTFDGEFFKTTGRIFILNSEEIVMGEKKPVAFDIQTFSAPGMPKFLTDTRFFKATTEWYKQNLLEKTNYVPNETYGIEKLYTTINPPHFTIKPLYYGISGSLNIPYNKKT